MKKVKVITKNAELEKFLARTDIEIINVDIRSCEQSWFAQEYFTATVYYDDEPKSDYIPDYWTRLEHQYAGMAMQAYIIASHISQFSFCESDKDMRDCKNMAHALVEKLKNE